jgi:hypothetical protein
MIDNNKETFRSGDRVTTNDDRNGRGTVTGWVGYPTPKLVRVQFDDGYVGDYRPAFLTKINDRHEGQIIQR